MQINSNDQYLKLLLRALETSVLPELKAAAPAGIAEIMRLVLLELRKREGPAEASLLACIAEGEAIEASLREFLVQEGVGPAVGRGSGVSLADGDSAGFSPMVSRHAALTARLSGLSRQLASLRRSADVHAHAGDDGAELLRRVANWETSYYRRQASLAPVAPPDVGNDGRLPLSRELLERFLNERSADPRSAVTVTSFQPILGGYGKQTYICEVRNSSGAESELIVRKTDPLDHMKFGFSAIDQEYHLLQSLSKTDFPSPRPGYLAFNPPGVDGSFFTMPRIPGRVAGTFLGGVNEGHSEAVYLKLAQLMAQLHRMPIETFGDYIHAHGEPAVLSADIGECYRMNLEAWERYVQNDEFLPSPYLSWLFDWLFHHVPRDNRRPVLVHGDFNVHNVLAEEGVVTGVLDWECAGFGAPEQDLAYVRPHISKHVDWNRFVAHYRASGGPVLNEDIMRFCNVYSTIRLNLGGNRLTLNLQRGTNLDIRYAMVELGFSQAFMDMGLSA